MISGDANPAAKLLPLVEARGLSKTYRGTGGAAVRALAGFDLTITTGEIVCLIGPSGSGKSTALRMINGLERPDVGSGGLRVLGHDLLDEETDMDRVRADVGMVFQHFNLFPHMTVVQNVMCGLIHSKGKTKSEAREIALGEIAKVGLSDRADHYPGQLSGGQKQRVAIARAIATKPLAMLFDEPTSALDPELRGSVLSVMRDLANEGMTMVVVTHEMGFARAVGNHIVFLEGGEIIEEGLSSDFLDNPKTDRARRFLSEIN